MMPLVPFIITLFIYAEGRVLNDPACEPLGFPEYGSIHMPNREVNGTARFSCKDGYYYKGTNPRVCQPNGEWSGSPGTCQAVQCPLLPSKIHGRIDYDGQAFNNTAKVTCDEGYIYSHPEHNPMVCQRDNSWTFQDGICQDVSCQKLQDPANGRLNYTGYRYKDTATVTCDVGYTYSDPPTTLLTCQGNNTWSDLGECQRIFCPSLPDEEMRIASTEKSYPGSIVIFTCQPGHQIEGSSILVCLDTGQWSDEPGKCITIRKRKNLLLLLLLPLIVICCLIGFTLWWRHKISKKCERSQVEMQDNENIEEIQLSRVHTEHTSLLIEEGMCYIYIFFVLIDKFDAGKSNPRSPEYMSFASKVQEKMNSVLKDVAGEGTKVGVDCMSEQKKMVSLHIKCAKYVTENVLKEALYRLDCIKPGSIRVQDRQSAELANEIIKEKHVKDVDLDRRIDLETQYVRLKVLSNDQMSAIPRDEMEVPDKYQKRIDRETIKDITDEDIVQQNETQNYVVIRGRAGIGKTTLMQRLMWRWACGEWATHLKVIFLFNLRVLLSITGTLDLADLLSRCGVYRPGNGVTAKWIKENEEQIGLVLDGLDEVHSFEPLWKVATHKHNIHDSMRPIDWCILMLKRFCLPKSTLIVSSRPFKGLSCVISSSMIEVMGLTRERVIEFIEKNVNKGKIDFVKDTMMNRPILLSVSAITFYCAALCSVLQDDIIESDKLFTYTQITAYITTIFLQRSVKTSGNSEIQSRSLLSLCLLAYKGLLKRVGTGLAQLVFEEQDLNDMTAEDVEWARKSGLFLQTEVPDLKNTNKKQLLGEFVHLSIQEFLAMAGLLMQAPENIKDTLKMLKTSGQFNMALLFLYGFAFDNKQSPIQKLFVDIDGRLGVDQDVQYHLQNMIHDVSDEMQLLQMVHESQSPQIAQHVGQEKFKGEVKFKDTKMTVVDMMALTFLMQHSPTTTSIELRDVGLDAQCVKELSDLFKTNNTVATLKLWDKDMDDTGVNYLCEALKVNSTLTELLMWQTNVTDQGASCLAALLNTNTTLQRLEFDSKAVTDQGVASLADALHTNTSLQHLEIGSYLVADQGVASLVDVLHINASLQHLGISSFEMTDRRVASLATVLHVTTVLQHLDLPLTTLHDEGANALLQALDANNSVTVMVCGVKCSLPLQKRVEAHDRIKCQHI